MEPLTIGILAGSIFAGLTGASLAALKGWQGWLELKRFELTHDSADRGLRKLRTEAPALHARPTKTYNNVKGFP